MNHSDVSINVITKLEAKPILTAHHGDRVRRHLVVTSVVLRREQMQLNVGRIVTGNLDDNRLTPF